MTDPNAGPDNRQFFRNGKTDSRSHKQGKSNHAGPYYAAGGFLVFRQGRADRQDDADKHGSNTKHDQPRMSKSEIRSPKSHDTN
jgi:hypothetical protein